MKIPQHARILAFAALLALGAVGAVFAQQSPIVLKNIAETEVAAKDAQGVIEKKRVPLTKALPGAEVIYTTTFENHGAKPVGNIVITNPVPANTVYVDGSALGENTVIAFSVNGGKTYGAANALSLRTSEGRERPALPADYTNIRWTYQGELRPGAGGAAVFRVVVK
jgi:uncharacterized repeat protein (TIGR01451 family)